MRAPAQMSLHLALVKWQGASWLPASSPGRMLAQHPVTAVFDLTEGVCSCSSLTHPSLFSNQGWNSRAGYNAGVNLKHVLPSAQESTLSPVWRQRGIVERTSGYWFWYTTLPHLNIAGHSRVPAPPPPPHPRPPQPFTIVGIYTHAAGVQRCCQSTP